jgi:hypothetical protein
MRAPIFLPGPVFFRIIIVTNWNNFVGESVVRGREKNLAAIIDEKDLLTTSG